MTNPKPSLASRRVSLPALTLAALPLLGLAGTPTLRAQEAEPQAAPEVDDPLVTVEFSGGTLREFGVRLRAAIKDSQKLYRERVKPINVLVPPIADQVEIPAMTLREVTVGTALESLQPLCAPRWRLTPRSVMGPGSPVHTLGVQAAQTRTTSLPVTTNVLSLRDLIVAPPGMENDPTSRLTADTILTAVDAGIKLSGNHDRVKLAYHEASGLLFVRAPAAEARLASQTIETLANDLETRRTQLHDEREAKAARAAGNSNDEPPGPTTPSSGRGHGR